MTICFYGSYLSIVAYAFLKTFVGIFCLADSTFSIKIFRIRIHIIPVGHTSTFPNDILKVAWKTFKWQQMTKVIRIFDLQGTCFLAFGILLRR